MSNKKIFTTLQSKSFAGRLSMAAVSLAAALVCGTVGAQGNSANPNGQTFAPGRILVMPRAGLPEAALARILKENGAGKAHRIGQSELRIIDVPPGLEAKMVERLKANPHFKFAELDQLVQPSLVTNDPYAGSEWHLTKIGADAAWDASQGNGVTIAILDGGVESTHPDLSARLVPGWNFYDNNSNTADVNGHGTRVAGAAAAASNNGIGVASVAGQAKIMPIRISDAAGTGSWSAMAQGLTYAADRGVRVANISYMVASSSSVASAAQYMKNKGGLVFVSAGNTGVEVTTAPTTSMIPVSATNSSDTRTSWSTYGNVVALSAPGESIYTTTNGGGYASVSGTSFSSPIAAGVAALVMAANSTLSSGDVEAIIFKSAVDLGPAGRDPYYGYGRVDARAAVQAALNTAVLTADTQAPAVSISSPLAGSTVSGLTTIDVSANDNIGVTRVELRANGSVVATDATAPFGFSWDTSNVANGTANLVAQAYDAAGNTATSSTVSVNVANNTAPPAPDTTPPVVSFVNAQSTLPSKGNFAVNAAASDNSGTAGLSLSLSINGSVVTTASGGSLSYKWNMSKLAPGTYTLTVTARDAAGNSSSQSMQAVK
jgi:thermitase